MNNISKFISTVYALLIFGGGVMGYIKASSVVSFVIGTLTGILVVAALKISEDDPNSGYLYVSSISLVLSGFFFFRFVNSGYGFMPGGLMFMISMVTFIITGLSWIKNKDLKKNQPHEN